MTLHTASAAVVKVSIGSPSGNRVAVLVRRGDVIPAGVDAEQLKRLSDRGLIAKQVEETEPTESGSAPAKRSTRSRAKKAEPKAEPAAGEQAEETEPTESGEPTE